MNDLWKERIKQYRESGMGAARWCKEKGVSASGLRYHLYKRKPKSEPKFIELKSEAMGLRLKVGNAILELTSDFDESTLKRFLSILVNSC